MAKVLVTSNNAIMNIIVKIGKSLLQMRAENNRKKVLKKDEENGEKRLFNKWRYTEAFY